MSEVVHTQGLWEIVPEGDFFKIITTESNRPICTVNKHQDAALIVCASAMFTALCFAADALEREIPEDERRRLSKTLRAMIKQANGNGEETRYGAIV